MAQDQAARDARTEGAPGKSFVRKFDDVFDGPSSKRRQPAPVEERYRDVEQRPRSMDKLPQHAEPKPDDKAPEKTEDEDPDELHPATVQMLARMPKLIARGTIYAIVLFIGVTILWLALSETDVVVKGNGMVVPEGKVENVSAKVNGVLETLHIEEGEIVEEGQVLFELSAREVEAEAGQIRQTEFDEVQARDALNRFLDVEVPRYEGQIKAMDRRIESIQELIDANEELLESLDAEEEGELKQLEQELAALEAKRELYKADLEANKARLQADIDRLEAQLESAEEGVDRLEERVEFLRKEMYRKQENFRQGIEIEAAYTQARLAYLEALGPLEQARENIDTLPFQIAALEQQVKQAESNSALALSELEREIAKISYRVDTQLADEYEKQRKSINKAIAENQSSLASLELEKTQLAQAHQAEQQRLEDAFAQAEKAVITAKERAASNQAARIIKAPIRGTITSLHVRREGEFVQMGQRMCTIAGEQAGMIAEITLKNKDIGELEVGDKVKLKFHAFPYQEYGVVQGELISLSPDAIVDEELGPVYRLEATFDPSTVKRPEDVNIRYGMTADAEIVQRKRTLLDIVLDPIKKISDKFSPGS